MSIMDVQPSVYPMAARPFLFLDNSSSALAISIGCQSGFSMVTVGEI